MLAAFLCLAKLGICWVYPLIQTFDSIDKNKFDSMWCSYWLVFGVLYYLEITVLSWVSG